MISELPIIAVITPFFETGLVFHDTATSLFAQTLLNWQWIIVNDGSQNPLSLLLLEDYRSRDERIFIVDQENKGLSAARNVGVKHASTSLLFFLDSDDMLAPNALARLLAVMNANPRAAFATSWVQTFGSRSFIWPHGFDSENQFLFENTITPLSIVRRDVFDVVGGFNESRLQGLEDYEFWIRSAALGYWGVDIPEPLIFQRQKTLAEYTHYTWANRDDPTRLRTFQDEMRQRYPRLYREGIPHLRATGKSAKIYARERIGLWAYPMTRWLRRQRIQIVASPLWKHAGPLWQNMKRCMR